jgi:hypothetical protein
LRRPGAVALVSRCRRIALRGNSAQIAGHPVNSAGAPDAGFMRCR